MKAVGESYESLGMKLWAHLPKTDFLHGYKFEEQMQALHLLLEHAKAITELRE